jgi:putative (di)nucleoside polyphosphate hydrolase
VIRYRSNVAALIVRSDGSLLICERWTIPGAWQFPQGGVDAGETLEEALFREVKEEIGIGPKHYKILEKRAGYRYLYPEAVQKKKLQKHGNQGQEQTYFLCKLADNAPQVDVNQKPREFRAYRWIDPEEFDLDWLPKFKRDVYRQVMADFFELAL